MRKANKIMMITVSVLLCLVLFTSTALSGTLAKYSTSGQTGTASARVAKWGVGIDISLNTTKLAKVSENVVTLDVAEDVTHESDNTIVYSFYIRNLKLGPGDDLRDLVKVTFDGTAEVKLRVKVMFGFLYGNDRNNYSYDHIKVSSGIGGVSGTKTYVMPVGFTFGASNSSKSGYIIDNDYVAAPWRSYTGSYPSTVIHSTRAFSPIGMNSTEYLIVNAIKSKLAVNAQNPVSGKYDDAFIYKDFAPNEDIIFYKYTDSDEDGVADENELVKTDPIDTFDMGLVWPFSYTYPSDYDGTKYTADQMDEIDTWFAKNRTSEKFSVIYTISLEQIQ